MSYGPAADLRSIAFAIRGKWRPDRIDNPKTWAFCAIAVLTISAGVPAVGIAMERHPAIAGAGGDLSGAIGMAVQARLGHHEFSRRPYLPVIASRRLRNAFRPSVRFDGAALTPVGLRYRPKTARATSAHSPAQPLV